MNNFHKKCSKMENNDMDLKSRGQNISKKYIVKLLITKLS